MRKISEIYDIMDEVRERIIKTMDERGITEVSFDTDQKWLNENTDATEDEYYDHIYDMRPWVVIFDKHGIGYDYHVSKIKLLPPEQRILTHTFDIKAIDEKSGEEKNVAEYYISAWTIIGIYDALEEKLGI